MKHFSIVLGFKEYAEKRNKDKIVIQKNFNFNNIP